LLVCFGWQLPQQLLFIWQQHESEVIHAGHQAVRKAQNWYWVHLDAVENPA
jgi:hypothetical protein